MKKIKYSIIIIILLALNFVYSFTTKEQRIYDKTVEEGYYTNVGQIAESTIITQTFLCEKSSLTAFEIKFGNFGRTNQTELFYRLEEIQGDVVAEGTFDASEIDNNTFYKIKLPEKIESKNKEYKLVIGDNETSAGAGVTILKTSKSSHGLDLSVEGKYAEKVSETEALVMKILTYAFSLETFIILIFFEIFVVFFVKVLYKFLK